MRRALTFATLLTVLALPAVAQDAAPRYTVDVTVMKAGVETASGRTIIVEGGQGQVLLNGADGEYNFTADLQPEQGDGEDDVLVLQAALNHDGTDLASPNMTIRRGGSALMRTGTEGPDGALTDGISIALTPLPVT